MKKLILVIALFAFISAGTANAAISVFSDNATEVVKDDKDKKKKKKKKKKEKKAKEEKESCSSAEKKTCCSKLCSFFHCGKKKQSTNTEEVQ